MCVKICSHSAARLFILVTISFDEQRFFILLQSYLSFFFWSQLVLFMFCLKEIIAHPNVMKVFSYVIVQEIIVFPFTSEVDFLEWCEAGVMIHLSYPYGNPPDSAFFVVKAILSSLERNDSCQKPGDHICGNCLWILFHWFVFLFLLPLLHFLNGCGFIIHLKLW